MRAKAGKRGRLDDMNVVPAAVAMFMGGNISEKESHIIVAGKSLYRPLLEHALRLRWLIVSCAAVLVTFSLWLATTLGSEFIPQLDEGDIALHALRIPGTSLSQAIAMQELLEARLKEFPEVDKVYAKIGTPEVATDPMPPSVADNFVMLKPRSQWPDPRRSKQDLVAEIETAVRQLPGNNYEFTQPIEMRFNELISGVRADLGIKVFGDDLEQLATSAMQIQAVVEGVAGAADVGVEQVSGLPMLSIVPKRTALALYGLNVADLQELAAAGIGGREAGVIYEGDRRFKLVVRLPEELRSDIDSLAFLPVPVPDGDFVPLNEVAELELKPAPAQISRENGKRRIVVTANVRNRDLGSFVAEVKERVATEVPLPESVVTAEVDDPTDEGTVDLTLGAGGLVVAVDLAHVVEVPEARGRGRTRTAALALLVLANYWFAPNPVLALMLLILPYGLILALILVAYVVTGIEQTPLVVLLNSVIWGVVLLAALWSPGLPKALRRIGLGPGRLHDVLAEAELAP